MAVIETWFEQDLQKAVQVQHLDGSLFSNNANGNRIGVVVYNNGVAASLSGTVSGYAVLPDGTTVPCTGSLSGNRASVLIPAAAYQPGIIFVSVFLTSGSTVTTLAAVAANVQQARTDSQVSPGSAVTDWTQTINAAMQAVVTANAANMAVEYGSLTYPVPVGKYTIYNDLLYRCTTPIATAESWTASHWTRVRIADEVSDLKSALAYADDKGLTIIEKSVIWQNGYVNASGIIVSSSLSGFALVPILAGETVKIGTNNNNITIIGSTTASSVSVGDSITVIQKTSSTQQFEEYSYTAEENINLVLSVKLSDYRLSFYKASEAINDLKSAFDDVTGRIFDYVGIQYTHEETVTSDTTHYFDFLPIIKSGTTFTIKNIGTAGQWTLLLKKADGTYSNEGSVVAGYEKEITAEFDVYGIRSYVSGTQWKFTVNVSNPNSLTEKTENAINDLRYGTVGFEHNHEETVTSDTIHYFELNPIIKSGRVFKITSNASSGSFSVNLVPKTGSESYKGTCQAKGSITITAPFDVYKIRSYVSGTSYNFTIEVYGDQEIEIDEIGNVAYSNQTAIKAIGAGNVFKLNYTDRETNGMKIKVLSDNSIELDGTASADTNFELAFNTFPTSENMIMYLDCPDALTDNTNIYLQPGASTNGGAVQQPTTKVYPNVKTEVKFNSGYIKSRCYLHLNSGIEISHAKIIIYASSEEPFDGTTVQENTFISDYNEENFTDAADDVNEIVLDTSGNNEQFLFFTDPHLAVQSGGGAGMTSATIPYINRMEAIYNASPMSFCLCGGDWLGNGDVPTVAASKLTYIDGFMRKKFKRYYPINGNHDTNYQGKETPSSQTGTGRIDNDVLKMFTDKFREENRMYYSFETKLSKWYIFDTGTESEAVELYQTQQLKWFAQSLLQNNDEHIIIALHILFPSAVGTTQPITEQILTIAEKYNLRESVIIDGQTYSYAEKTGEVSFCIAGHMHSDWNGTVHNIPCILTANATNGNTLTFDLCVADFTDKKLYMKRVGTGNDRTVTIL